MSASPGRWSYQRRSPAGCDALHGGWANVSEGAKAEWQRARAAMSAAGVEVLGREGDDKVAAFEDAMQRGAVHEYQCLGRTFPLDTYNRNMEASKLSESAHNRLKQALRMTQNGPVCLPNVIRYSVCGDPRSCRCLYRLSAPGAALKGSTGRATRCLRCLLLWWACRRSPCRFYRTKTCR